ncbi:MAG: hypothetical protein QM756_45370 [Polyangiaceae bacterium]
MLVAPPGGLRQKLALLLPSAVAFACSTSAGGTPAKSGSGTGAVMLDGLVARGDFCVLEFGGIYFEVNWKLGGRVTSAKVGQNELLTGPALNAVNFGSTFWTSPQSDWSWPPVAEVDSGLYSASVDAISCTLVGPVVASSTPAVNGIRVTKKFSADFEKQAIVAEYTLTNTTGAAKKLAPWEITRVAAGGLTFYASDSAPMQAGTRPLLPTSHAHGVYWFRHDESTPKDGKLNSDGKGWVAHVTPQNAVLIKTFPDIQPSEAAAGEAEIEIYANAHAAAANAYVEVENQGAYTEVRPGGQLSWTVRWYLRALPPNIFATPGNPDLVAFVTQAIQ